VTETVRDNRALERYELDTAAGPAFIDYHRNGNTVTMLHAEVPPSLRGRDIGSALVRGALELVREQGESVIPRCPFVVAYVNRHPDVQDLVARPR
jgi:uncharacterized protein